MQITLKLYAALHDYLPDEANNHVALINIVDDETPFGVIDRYKIPREKAYLFFLNGLYISPSMRQKPIFKDGDTLAVWPPVAGG